VFLEKLLKIWDEWHLNDLRPYCIHQKEFLLENVGTTKISYDDAMEFEELRKCSICGYEYGSGWRYEPLPKDVEDFILSILKYP